MTLAAAKGRRVKFFFKGATIFIVNMRIAIYGGYESALMQRHGQFRFSSALCFKIKFHRDQFETVSRLST